METNGQQREGGAVVHNILQLRLTMTLQQKWRWQRQWQHVSEHAAVQHEMLRQDSSYENGILESS